MIHTPVPLLSRTAFCERVCAVVCYLAIDPPAMLGSLLFLRAHPPEQSNINPSSIHRALCGTRLYISRSRVPSVFFGGYSHFQC